jgi:8-oxo-dGTP diphosphatase
VINVICAIILKEEKILVTQRSEKMKLPLKWEFPGGKLESGESEEECILREIKEELNINIEIIGKLSCSVFDYGSFNVNLIPFISNYISGEIALSEHKDFKWMKKSELSSLDWAEADLPILKEFLSL